MKIIFEAFGRMLKSDPMEFPEETGLRFRLPMDMDSIKSYGGFGAREAEMGPPRTKVGDFEFTGRTCPLGNGRTARIYTLVDIF